MVTYMILYNSLTDEYLNIHDHNVQWVKQDTILSVRNFDIDDIRNLICIGFKHYSAPSLREGNFYRNIADSMTSIGLEHIWVIPTLDQCWNIGFDLSIGFECFSDVYARGLL